MLIGAAVSPYPSALLLCAIGMAIEAGEDGAQGHGLAGLVPAMGVAESGCVALALLVQDGVQSVRGEKEWSGVRPEHFKLFSNLERHLHISAADPFI